MNVYTIKITEIDNGYILYYQKTTNHELFYATKKELLEKIEKIID